MNIELEIQNALPHLRAWLRANMSHLLQSKLPVEDVVQEVCLKAIAKSSGFEYRGAAQLQAWLRAIARNQIRDTIRKRSVSSLGSLAQSIIDSGDIRPSEVVRNREAVQRLQGCIDALPALYKEVLMAKYVSGVSFESIAQAMGKTSAAIRGLHRNAIKRLRVVLEESDDCRMIS